jgi:hypothetical protein
MLLIGGPERNAERDLAIVVLEEKNPSICVFGSMECQYIFDRK